MSERVCEREKKNTKSFLLSESSCSILSEIFGSVTKQHSFHSQSSPWQQIFLDWEISGPDVFPCGPPSSGSGHLGLCGAQTRPPRVLLEASWPTACVYSFTPRDLKHECAKTVWTLWSGLTEPHCSDRSKQRQCSHWKPLRPLDSLASH